MRQTVVGSAALALVFTLSCGKPDRPVAQVDGQWVGQEQWSVFCENHGVGAGAGAAERQEGLKRLVRREVGAVLAQRRGKLSGKEWESKVNEISDAAAAEAYLRSRLAGRPTPTAVELEARFRADRESRHILLVPLRSEADARRAAAELAAGREFAKVVSALGTKDPNLPPDGDLGSARRAQLPEHLQVPIFAAKEGEIVGPVRSGPGWVVVKVAEVKVPTHEEFLKAEGDLRREARERALAEENERAVAELKTKYLLESHPEALQILVEGRATSTDAEKVAGKVGGAEILLGQVAAAWQEGSQRAGRPLPKDRETLTKLLEVLADQARVVAEAKARKFGQTPEAKALLWDMKQELAARVFVEGHLEEIAVPEATLSEYFNKNRERFRVPDQMHLRYLIAPNPDVLNKAVGAAKSGAPWEEVVKTPGLLPETGGGDTGWRSDAELAQAIPREVLSSLTRLESGQWSGGAMAPGKFAAFQLVDIKRGGLPAFDAVREPVRRAYLSENGQKLAFEYLDGPGRDGIAIREFPENLAPAK